MLCGGSTAIFMFVYCIYFYVRSSMSGFLQLSFFIGYNACICYAFFLIFGAISFRVSLLFLRCIYHDVKREWVTYLKHKAILVTSLMDSAILESEVCTMGHMGIPSLNSFTRTLVQKLYPLFLFCVFKWRLNLWLHNAHFGRGFLVANLSLGGRD